MAVDINKVYQKVLAIANKEQRGYITPKEFNLFADHAQKDIFEQYFYDLEQRQRAVGNETSYSDIISNIEEKISLFEQYSAPINVNLAVNGVLDISSQIGNIYRLGSVTVRYGGLERTADKIRLNELNKYENSLIGRPTQTNPVYTEYSTNGTPMKIKIYPTPQSGHVVRVDYIRIPRIPRWTYIISSTGNALYNHTLGTQHFELHRSEETNLVIKILLLAGVAIKDSRLVQAAAQEEIKGIQQEKQ